MDGAFDVSGAAAGGTHAALAREAGGLIEGKRGARRSTDDQAFLLKFERVGLYTSRMPDAHDQQVLQLFVRHQPRIKGFIVSLLPDFADGSARTSG
jgi:hypothetical protein